jgi:hypothetical protein
MLRGDLSNQQSFVIGVQCEGTLLIPKQKVINNVLHFLTGESRYKVNQKVLDMMYYIYSNTEYTVALVIDDKLYKEEKKRLEDYPFNTLINNSKGNILSMLNTGVLSYLIDDNTYQRGVLNNKYVLSFNEFEQRFRRKIKKRIW